MSRFFVLLIAIFLLFLATSCNNSFVKKIIIAGEIIYVDRDGERCNKLPNWVKKLPIKSGKIYAIGFSMPDTNPNCSLEIAKRKAIIELSKTVETIIKIDSQKIDEFIRVNKNGKATNIENTVVLKHSIKVDVLKIVSGGVFEEIFYDNCNYSGRGEKSHFVLISLSK
jgi:hypothetical protein